MNNNSFNSLEVSVRELADAVRSQNEAINSLVRKYEDVVTTEQVEVRLKVLEQSQTKKRRRTAVFILVGALIISTGGYWNIQHQRSSARRRACAAATSTQEALRNIINLAEAQPSTQTLTPEQEAARQQRTDTFNGKYDALVAKIHC